MIAFELTATLGTLLISFFTQTIIVAGLLWCTMKLFKKKASPVALIAAAAIASLIGFTPFVGPVLSFIALILLLSSFTRISKRGSVMIVTLAWGLGLAATVGLFMLLELLSVEI